MLWRCQWLNKHLCLTCSSVRLFVAVVPASNEPQQPQIPLLILSQVDAGELCWEMWRASCWQLSPALHIPLNRLWDNYGLLLQWQRAQQSPCLHPEPWCFPTHHCHQPGNFCKTSGEEQGWRLRQAPQLSFDAATEPRQLKATAPLLGRWEFIRFHSSLSSKRR